MLNCVFKTRNCTLKAKNFVFKTMNFADDAVECACEPKVCGAKVSFQGKNPDFLLKNPDFLIRNPDFRLENVGFIIKTRRRWMAGAFVPRVCAYSGEYLFMHNLDPKTGANCGFCYVYIFPGIGTAPTARTLAARSRALRATRRSPGLAATNAPRPGSYTSNPQYNVIYGEFLRDRLWHQSVGPGCAGRAG